MTVFNSLRSAITAPVAALIFGTGAASAATVQVTIDFGTGGDLASVSSPYTEDGFEIAGTALVLGPIGAPGRSIFLYAPTPTLTLTRTGGGTFSLVSFDYSCLAGECNFSVGTTSFTSGSSGSTDFATASPPGFASITSLVFSSVGETRHRIDNIVLTYEDDLTPIPVPAALPLLLAGLGGLGLMARRKARAA